MAEIDHRWAVDADGRVRPAAEVPPLDPRDEAELWVSWAVCRFVGAWGRWPTVAETAVTLASELSWSIFRAARTVRLGSHDPNAPVLRCRARDGRLYDRSSIRAAQRRRYPAVGTHCYLILLSWYDVFTEEPIPVAQEAFASVAKRCRPPAFPEWLCDTI
jgi:hypothetical protein